MIFNTFGGTLPEQFDPRSFAIRQGLQRYVAASSLDVVEDQMQFRMGVEQRWQTKRGLPGRERIADLYEVDVAAISFRKTIETTLASLWAELHMHQGCMWVIA